MAGMAWRRGEADGDERQGWGATDNSACWGLYFWCTPLSQRVRESGGGALVEYLSYLR